MKLLAIVVLYYPDARVKENIMSYAGQVDRLIVWNNTPAGDGDRPLRFDEPTERKIVRMGTGRNAGIGAALNEAVRYGQAGGYTHLLTMDQDSRFGEGMAAAFFRSVQKLSPAEEPDTVLQPDTVFTATTSSTAKAAAPAPRCPAAGGNIASYSASTRPYAPGAPETEEIEWAITSGTLYRLSVFRETGLFRDDFFIDAIDTEFGFRLRKNGWKMLRMNQIYLYHELGRVTETPFLWGKLVTPHYPAQRTYYLVRNTLALKRLYPDYRQSEGLMRMLFFWRPVCILFVETDKWRKFKAIFYGIAHALRGKRGEYRLR